VERLRRAVEAGEVEAVEALVSSNPGLATARLVDPDIATLWTTPLHVAASYDHAGVVSVLLSFGASAGDPDSRGEGRTALVEACQYAGAEVVKALVGSAGGPAAVGLRVGDADGQWELPVHVASRAGDADVVSALLDAGGADAAAVDSGGETPLHKAASYDRLDVARVLVSALGPSARRRVHVQDSDGETPLHDAVGEGSEEVAEYLCLTPSLMSEAEAGIADNRGDLVLHRLACLGPSDGWGRRCVQSILLLSKGAGLGVINKAGMTPLVLAAQHRNLPFCEGVRDWLHAAQKLPRAQGPASAWRPPEVLERNLCCGRGKESETALHAAVRQGETELVELLLELGCSPATQNGARDHVLYVAPKGHPVGELIREALERHEGGRKEKGRLAWNDAFDKYQKSCSDALVAVLDSGMEEGYKMNIHATRGPGGGGGG